MTFVVALLLLAGPNREEPDSVMYRDPEIHLPNVVTIYPKGMAELWLAALERPERETTTNAALAIAAAHEQGMPGLAVAAGPLTKLLDRPDAHASVRVAAARALVALDARDAAPSLFRIARSGDAEFRDVIEPVLARWDYRPVRDVWLDRLNQPPPYGHGFLLAIRGLGTVRDERAAPRLRELALASDLAPSFRLAAARALGEIRTTGSVADAAPLVGDTTPRGMTGRLVAASLLRRHDGGETVRLLQSLARDPEPTVAAAALMRLAEIDTKQILPVKDAVLASAGAEVRQFGVDALFRHPSHEHIATLSGRLNDPHPGLRVRTRRHLAELAAADEWRATVIDRATRALAASDWRGQEQAAVLLGQLGHTPASERLVALMRSNRGEVLVAVGWALRKLAVPETLPRVLDHVRQRHADMLRDGPTAGLRTVPPDALDRHLSHLVQFLGQARYQPAAPALRALVPRFTRSGMPPGFTPVGGETRAAAIWSLGLIHEGKPDEKLVAQIEDRLTGDPGMGSDDARVRRMAAISLARMGAKQSLEALDLCAQGSTPTSDPTANACRWAAATLRGQPAPAPGTIEIRRIDWFLLPLK